VALGPNPPVEIGLQEREERREPECKRWERNTIFYLHLNRTKLVLFAERVYAKTSHPFY
jgi:hypothetical protein